MTPMVLIVIFTMSGGHKGVEMQDFQSYAKCQAAKAEVINWLEGRIIYAGCVEK